MTGTVREDKRHIGAYLDLARARRLVELARREDRSVSSVIRRAIEAELERADGDGKEAA
jgi:predicted transcriptional regulator